MRPPPQSTLVLPTATTHPQRAGKGGVGGRLSYPVLFSLEAQGFRRVGFPSLPFLLAASAQGAGERQGVQGLDAELGDAWGAGRTAEKRVRT